MGAMTIVEVVDAHKGFDVVTSRIKTTQLSSLLWLVSGVTFFLSAILDNLTTTIVMVSLLKKLLDKREDRLLFAGLIVIAANSGGAWSPIGDVTTTMLWIGGQITAGSIIQSLFVPSLVGLGLLWMVGDVLHKGKTMEERSHLELSHALSRIDMYSIVFFIGILLAVA
jgi:Na+/H+ antiporter NhaD/arsenite permease-like protein